MPTWKRVVLALSAASVSFGFALGHFESQASPDSPDSPGSPGSPGPSTARADDRAATRATMPAPAGDAVPLADAVELDAPFTRSGDTGSRSTGLEADALTYGSGFAGTQSLAPSGTPEPTASAALPVPDGSSSGALGLVPPADGAPAPHDASRAGEGPPPSTATARLVASHETGGGAIPWSPLFVKGGLSVFLGFCVGHALRAFFRITAVLVGLGCIATLALQYYGILDLDWSAASGAYDVAVARVTQELESLGGFVSGTLPSAGLASFGLFAGFKRSV